MGWRKKLLATALLTLFPSFVFASNPLVIYGYVYYEGNFLPDIEIEAINERSGEKLNAISDENGAYVLTFGSPPYNWEIGDKIIFRARGKNCSCLYGYKEIIISSDEPLKLDIPLNVDLNPNFIFTPSQPKIDENISFIDNSIGSISNYTWNFGDGNFSYEKNPKHAYEKEGKYNVKLTVSCNSFSRSISKEIVVYEKKEKTPGFEIFVIILAILIAMRKWK
ncbi:MAG: PKD domain-containing protein [Thermoplasmatales archaeon]|nr:PKD domain-containing protein [Thermoplasmatales archaeon]